MISLKKLSKKSLTLLMVFSALTLVLTGCGNKPPVENPEPPSAIVGEENPNTETVDPKVTAEARQFMDSFEEMVESGNVEAMLKHYSEDMFDTLSGIDRGNKDQMQALRQIMSEVDFDNVTVYPHGGYSFEVQGVIEVPDLSAYTPDDLLKNAAKILEKESITDSICAFALKLDKVDGQWVFSGDEGLIQNISAGLVSK